MLFRLVVLLFSLNASPAFAQALSPAVPSPQTILVLGDSLSAAHGIARNQGWVTLLAERMAQKTPPWKVINASISGETTSGGLTRLPALLTAQRPQWVLIELGANDGLRGLPLKIIRQNLHSLIQQSQASGARVILIGMMLPPNYGFAYTTPFTAMYQQLAEEQRLPLVPFLLQDIATDPALMQADGLHPAAAAQSRVFENVWRVAAPLWNEQAGTTPQK
jgi:acyl-CoA thioesterase-1